MKKVLIGLLIIAAGAGIFFYLRTKQNPIADNSNKNKELILGTWTIDSVHTAQIPDSSFKALIDSVYKATTYTFNKEHVIGAIHDKIDTATYTFKTDSTMLWKSHNGDSAILDVAIWKLDSLNLVVNTISHGDTSTLFLRKQVK